jgi:uncharacterized protein (TIGR00369 family)
VLPEPGFFALSGLEQLRVYLDERLPATPHAHLLGYRVTQASSGTAVISQPLTPWFEIYDGFVDLTAIAELSVFLAAMTVAPPAVSMRTVTQSLRYLRPCTVDDESVVARARVVHAGSSFTTAETLIEDRLGRAVAHATGCVLAIPIDPPPAPMARPLGDRAEEPTYPTPGPSRRRVTAAPHAGQLPLFGQLLGVETVESTETTSVTSMEASEWFCNTSRHIEPGIVASHGTVTASLINPHLVPPDDRAVTFETSSSFLAAVPADGGPLVCRAALRARVDDIWILETETTREDGTTVLVGSGTMMAQQRRSPRFRRPANRMLLTVVFTDLVGSTERAAELGDARWRELLDAHHQLVRRQIESHNGREVKTTGDGFLVTFESPSSAVLCARAIRDGVERFSLQIRAGVHTGECEVVGGDVAGLAVHVASRVQSAAQPGQVLVSSTVRDLLAGSGLDVVDEGTHQLKGLSGDWRLYSLA